MKITKLHLLTILGSGLITATAHAEEQPKLVKDETLVVRPAIEDGLCVHNFFQSNMVVQRDKPIIVRGWATPGETVKISFAGETAEAQAAKDRSWRLELPAKEANSNPQSMVVEGKSKTITLDNILIGDIWLLTGQSNMAHPLRMLEGGSLEAAAANYPKLRLLTIPEEFGRDPHESFPSRYRAEKGHQKEGFWEVAEADSNTVSQFSGLGYVFARLVHQASGVPVGAIDLSVGGTTLAEWTPREVLKSLGDADIDANLAEWDKKVSEYDAKKDLAERIAKYKEEKDAGKKFPDGYTGPTDLRPGPDAGRGQPGSLFASMANTIAGFNVKGILWHQGYNDAFEGTNGARKYELIFPEKIAAWRKAFNDEALPYCIISLCTAGTFQDEKNYCLTMFDGGINIREVQYKTFEKLYRPGENEGDKNIGFVSSYDQRVSWYHPHKKFIVSQRAASWALTKYYGKHFKWEPPHITEVKVGDGVIELSFNGWVKQMDDVPWYGFAIAGEDKVFHPAQCERFVISRDAHNRPKNDMSKLVLSSPHVEKPIHYRYGWGRNPMTNVASFDGVPLGTQRSDNWSDEELYESYYNKPTKEPRKMDRTEAHFLRKFLIEQDTRRQIREAEAFLAKHRKVQ